MIKYRYVYDYSHIFLYMKSIKAYFDFAVKKNVSDLHLVGNEFPYVRIHGQLIRIEEKKISKFRVRNGINEPFK